MSDKENPLSAKEEKLLIRYFDGALGFGQKRKVEKLLARKAEAKAFIEELSSLGEELRKAIADAPEVSDELWQKVSRRINQEEKAAAFLGKRDFDSSAVIRPKWKLAPWSTGLAGATVVALLAFSFWYPMQDGSLGAKVDTVKVKEKPVNSSNINFVSSRSPKTENNRGYQAPRILKKEYAPYSRPIEVDWVKSDGRVRMIPGGQNSAPIIWVKKKLPSKRRLNSSRYEDKVLILERKPPIGLPVNGN